ncbi:uncharacterized protein LOC141607648 [Silene latifolia]|uniref:uncharacterized protein LOC141607648 n=1 Tax=Silene latifolia TaxID=37657 RepID=UPI003D77F6C2
MKLSSLMFADDLLLFSKGDVGSMMILLRTFSTFSKASGLQLSKGKSNVYFNGVPADIRSEIIHVSGCSEGAMPFKYLGVPIKPSKLSIKDCQPIIDKVLERIRNLGTKKLSYAGRLILVKYVYKTLHSYWASIFILPKGVIVKIEAICRNFLWSGGSEFTKNPTVAWSKICTEKKQGGLGLMNECLRNKAAVGKLLWWIHIHPDKLWVKWIHSTYLRTTTWGEYQCPSNVSWTWKKVCKLRNELQQAYSQNEWSRIPGKEYSIRKGYTWLQGALPEVIWQHKVWNKWTVPKHGMIAWMAQHQGINTKDKLFRLNISNDNLCCLCGKEEETLPHLFFKCHYSEEIMMRIQNWVGLVMPRTRDHEWRRGARMTRLKVGILNSILNAVTYHVWRQRNECRHEMKLIRPDGCVNMIKYEIRTKINKQLKGKLSRKDLVWIEKLM